jgi:hypothetical protein
MAISTWFAHGAAHSVGSMFEPATRTVNYATNNTVPNDLPGVGELIDMGVKGWISRGAMTAACRLHGAVVDPFSENPGAGDASVFAPFRKLWEASFFAAQELPTVTEALTLNNRGILTDEQREWVIQRRGFSQEAVADAITNLRYDIPGSSDLVRFSVRHVFEPDLIAALGYNQEFRPILDFWHRTQGLNYPIFTGPFGASVANFEHEIGLPAGAFLAGYHEVGLEDPTWAQAYWWSHWVLPSPTQGYEMLFRLRPERNKAFDPPQARGVDFTAADLTLLLRANDYPPFYRDKLAAIAYRVPGIRFLRQLRSTDVFGQKDVIELLLRQGYSEGDAKVLAASVERADQQARRRQIESQAKATIGKYWEAGIITDEDYTNLLVQHGLTPGDAQQTLALAQVDLRYQRVKLIVTAVRKKYLRGELSDAQAAGQLRQAGISAERIGQHLEDWQVELSPTRKQLSAAQASKAACQGLMSEADFRTRLKNLGYPDQDVDVLAQEVLVCQVNRAAQAGAKAERGRQAQIRELQRQQKEAAQAIVTARRQLAAHGSPAQLRKWYCSGHIGVPEVYSRLEFLGWPTADIDRLLGDCKVGSETTTTGP